MRFTVTGAPAGSVQSAKLRLYNYNGTADGPAVYTTGTSWSETAVNWNTRPARTSAASGDKGAIPVNTWVEYDVTAFVTGNGTYSFNLATTSNDGIDFYNREAATLAARARGDPALPCAPVEQAQEGDRGDVVAVIAVASTALALGVADSASPPESGPKVETHVDHSYIYTVDVASGQLTQETNHQGEGALEPSWSAQGEIAFSTQDCDECASTLTEVDPDAVGSPEVHDRDDRRARLPAVRGRPTATGSRRSRSGAASTPWTRRPAAAQRLTTGPSDEAPDWSPAGDWIAFHRQVRGQQLRHLRGQRRDRRGAAAHERRQAADEPSWFPRRQPRGVRRAAGQRAVGDRHDEIGRHGAQADHGRRDQRPGAVLVARRQDASRSSSRSWTRPPSRSSRRTEAARRGA